LQGARRNVIRSVYVQAIDRSKSPLTFYDLPPEAQDQLLVLHSKAEAVSGRAGGFAGNIVMLDAGPGVFPRHTAAKFPMYKERLGAAELAHRFVREMKLQSAMHYHPNVHWPFDLKFVLGAPIAFFRRWRGDLSNLIEDASVFDEERLAILVQVITALRHCQERGVVCHQDLKPENIFIRDYRDTHPSLTCKDLPLTPLLADFGSVNLFLEMPIFSGSRPYMAPEQWDEQPLTERPSVFAIGIMLHELISRGEHPIGEHGGDWHRGENPVFNQWQRDRKWLSWKREGLPIPYPLGDAQLASIVRQSLAPSPEERPSLAELQQQLIDVLALRSQSAALTLQGRLASWSFFSSPPEWEHLNARIEGLERTVVEEYGPAPPPSTR
jgi:serine/threonine protein kinase